MSARDKDARAAMREIVRAITTGEVEAAPFSVVSHDAWKYADAMEAERAKRETPDAEPDDIGADMCRVRDPELAAARREGRDAGLREAVEQLTEEAISSGERTLAPNHIAAVINDMIRDTPDATPLQERLEFEAAAKVAEKLSALASENAKLRAVAEAAALICRDGGDFAEMQRALEGAGYKMVAGWRTK